MKQKDLVQNTSVLTFSLLSCLVQELHDKGVIDAGRIYKNYEQMVSDFKKDGAIIKK